jgi:ankyrin repeat protein
VARLLGEGADPNALVPGRTASGEVVQTTPLRQAASFDHLEAARLLLDAGADPDRACGDGLTPLMAAAGGGHLEVLRLLLGRGATVDAVEPGTGRTGFHYACILNHANCAEELARAGCDVGLKDMSGQTGREGAEEMGHAVVVARLRAVVAEQLRAAQAAGRPSPPPVNTDMVEWLGKMNLEFLEPKLQSNGVKNVADVLALKMPDIDKLDLKLIHKRKITKAIESHKTEPEPAAVVRVRGPAAKLVTAAAEGDGAAVARLLAAGADPNALVAGRTPSGKAVHRSALFAAARYGRLEAARLLLEAGADPSLADGDGATPLMVAASYGQLEVLRLLLRWGAVVDAVSPGNGGTAFHHACGSNQAECAEELARAGCDVGLKENNGHTGREVAEARGHAPVVERLRAAVAEQLRAAQAAAGPAPAPEPAGQLVTAAAVGNTAAVARLLAAGADPNALVAGRTPSGEVVQSAALHEAAGCGRLEAARLLLEAGADPSLADGYGCTSLMGAATSGQLEVLRLLLGRGATVDAVEPAYGTTAFHSACINDHAECAEALARAGCDVGLKDKSGHTGRELAEARGSNDAARRLRALARQPFVGVLVELAGLVGAAEHNGKRATVMSARPSRGHHTSVFLPRAHFVCTLRASKNATTVWQSNGGGIDHPRLPPAHPTPPAVPGAARPSGEAAGHAGAAGCGGRGRRRGEAHGRAAGELCAGAPAGRHAVRPGQEAPLAPAAAVRCSSRVL